MVTVQALALVAMYSFRAEVSQNICDNRRTADEKDGPSVWYDRGTDSVRES